MVHFNVPNVGEAEQGYLIECLRSRKLSGDGPFTKRCHEFLGDIYGSSVVLVHSGTAALEMAMLLIDLQPGDEVIMPSYTFVSTANAVVLRGAVPVFVDIRPDTLNIDETKIEAAITSRTRAIMPVHYAGVGAEMSAINAIAKKYNLFVVEDAAQGFGATYEGAPLGSIGDLGCLSFHETKNIVSGEGGALILNNPEFAERAQYIREKGTNRTQFLRREVMKYEWVDIGSSYLPSDLLAAVLLAQLERAAEIASDRKRIWERYYDAHAHLHTEGIRLPRVPSNVGQNHHIFYLQMPSHAKQQALLDSLRSVDIQASSHYVPLHSSPAGKKFARVSGTMHTTDAVAMTLVRLPLHSGLTDDEIEFVIQQSVSSLEQALAA